jgi:hypothetical protein
MLAAMTEHPVRLVLTDDLRRSRLTVFFRVFLTIPHLIWIALIGVAAAVCAFIGWFVVLFTGRLPQGLHDFIAGFVRYSVHIEAYLFLGADPYPPFYPFSNESYPIDVEIAPPAVQNRWKTGFRVILAIPAFIVSSALVGGTSAGSSGGAYFRSGGAALTAAFLIWFFALATARAPRGLRDVVGWGLGYSAQTSAYLLLLTDRYPYSGPEQHLPPLEANDPEADHPVTLQVDDDLRRSRLMVFFRLPLAIPHIVWFLLWGIFVLLVSIVVWVIALVMGRPPTWWVRFAGAFVRYTAHLSAFFWLIGNPFPGFVGQAGSYPIDVTAPTGGPQNRWRILFRLPLVIPALLLSGAVNGVLSAAGVLGWFVGLFRGRMPEGLRNGGAYAIGYGAQVLSYWILLTERYPDSTPLRLLRVDAPPGPVGEPPGAYASALD